jgi:hypothetical protein
MRGDLYLSDAVILFSEMLGGFHESLVENTLHVGHKQLHSCLSHLWDIMSTNVGPRAHSMRFTRIALNRPLGSGLNAACSLRGNA